MRCVERATHLSEKSLPRFGAQGRCKKQEPDFLEELLRRALGRVFDQAGVVPDTLEQRLQGASGNRISPEDRDCRRYGNQISLSVEGLILFVVQ